MFSQNLLAYHHDHSGIINQIGLRRSGSPSYRLVLITDCGLAVINCEDNRFIGQLTL